MCGSWPYVKGISEQLRKIFKKQKCGVYFKPQNTLRRLLVAPKDPAKKEEASGVVYRVKCGGGQRRSLLQHLCW